MNIGLQIAYLFILAIPVACIAWTVTHEEIFKEPRNYCIRRSIRGKTLITRKFFYMLTCEYCFSHYVAAATVIVTDYQLLYTGWKGYIIGGFSIVWVANIYMSLYGRLRLGIKKEKAEIDAIDNGQ
jgi:choline-glycine betaine transporter